MEEADYEQWLMDKKAEIAKAKQEAAASLTATLSKQELIELGTQVYVDRCAVCHQANGAGIPGAFPAITGSKIATGDIATHIDTIVNGRPGTAMQAFANQLTDKEIAAVVTYQRNGLGNDTGDVIQASDVNAFKAEQSGTSEEGQ
jgi:cytochrome c oxidase subunit 2